MTPATEPPGDGPGSLDPARVQSLLRGALGRPYRFVAECDSTQELARAGEATEGTVVATDHQRAGRGRSGRTWEDRPGDGLLFSIVLRPPATPVLPQLSLVVALAVAEGLEEAAGVPTGIKWPNDVEIGGAKVAGVLLEASSGIVTCGIGVNVNQERDRLPRATRRPAGSLRTATGRSHDRGQVLAAILAALERRYDAWRGSGLPALIPWLEARSTLKGRTVEVGGLRGIVEGFASDGRLRLRRPGGDVVCIDSGEITIAS